MEIPGTKRFIPKGFELGTTSSKPNGSIANRIHVNRTEVNIAVLI